MNHKIFEDFLMEKHAENYMGSDDDMSDKFDDWLTDLEIDDIIKYADKALNIQQEEFKKTLNSGRRMYQLGINEQKNEIIKVIEKKRNKYDQDDMIKYQALDDIIKELK